MCLLKCWSVIFLFATITVCHGIVLAPYQVSLRLYDNFNSNNGDSFSFCSGAIVHPHFVLTTAHCVHSHILSQQMSRPLSPNAIYVVAGNFSGSSLTVKYVNGIFFHNLYNDKTQENDIALIKLESPFDLKNTSDLQWLELPENSTKMTNCFYSFNNASSKPYPFTAPQSTSVADTWFCTKNNANFSTEISKTDICSHYVFSDSFMCKVTANQLKVSNDRGTPLVCNNKLVGLLSVIIPRSNSTNTTDAACDQNLQTMAYYTRVTTFVNWIHSIIGVNLPTTSDGKPTPIVPDAPPFQGPTTTSKPPSKGIASTICLSSSVILIGLITWLFVHRFTFN